MESGEVGGYQGEAGHLSDKTKTLNFQPFYDSALTVTAASNGIALQELHLSPVPRYKSGALVTQYHY